MPRKFDANRLRCAPGDVAFTFVARAVAGVPQRLAQAACTLRRGDREAAPEPRGTWLDAAYPPFGDGARLVEAYLDDMDAGRSIHPKSEHTWPQAHKVDFVRRAGCGDFAFIGTMEPRGTRTQLASVSAESTNASCTVDALCVYTDAVTSYEIDVAAGETQTVFTIAAGQERTWIQLDATGDIDLKLATSDGVVLLDYGTGTNWADSLTEFTYAGMTFEFCVDGCDADITVGPYYDGSSYNVVGDASYYDSTSTWRAATEDLVVSVVSSGSGPPPEKADGQDDHATGTLSVLYDCPGTCCTCAAAGAALTFFPSPAPAAVGRAVHVQAVSRDEGAFRDPAAAPGGGADDDADDRGADGRPSPRPTMVRPSAAPSTSAPSWLRRRRPRPGDRGARRRSGDDADDRGADVLAPHDGAAVGRAVHVRAVLRVGAAVRDPDDRGAGGGGASDDADDSGASGAPSRAPR
ncbi:hypothetical protein JL720_12410 [Aureococcus anophagefferens]|nr:hypothetical protein JL720_12410 [Aureococcus anophagefferens]